MLNETAVKKVGLPMNSPPPPTHFRELTTRIKRYKYCYLMLIPLLVFLAIFRYTPMINQFLLAFKDYRFADGIISSPWVGFEHFRRMFDSVSFFQVLWNTFIISILKIIWSFWPPIVLALMLNELRSKRFRSVSQTILYLPHFLSWVIVYGIAYAFLSPGFGIINDWIAFLGGEKVDLITSVSAFRPTIIISLLWKEIGWGTIIYLAALAGVDPELYDAASIDGANVWQRIWHITLPGIKPIIVFVFTLTMGSLLSAGFEQIYLFQTSATYSVSDTLETWVYRRGLQDMEYSFATAVGIFQGVVGLVLILVSNKLANKFADGGIW